MNSISTLLKNIKNLLPYFILIAIYFFVVNLEARKEQKDNRTSDYDKIMRDINKEIGAKNNTIEIPVIPYNK